MPRSCVPPTPGAINRLPCVFASAIARRVAVCEFASRCAGKAGAAGVQCSQPVARAGCAQLNGLLLEKSSFVARRLRPVSAANPPGVAATPAELARRIACGGLCGLRDILDAQAPAPNVQWLLHAVQTHFGDPANLPWPRIQRAIAGWRPGPRRATAASEPIPSPPPPRGGGE